MPESDLVVHSRSRYLADVSGVSVVLFAILNVERCGMCQRSVRPGSTRRRTETEAPERDGQKF